MGHGNSVPKNTSPCNVCGEYDHYANYHYERAEDGSSVPTIIPKNTSPCNVCGEYDHYANYHYERAENGSRITH